MREKSVVPTNLLSWPRCNGLLPDQRLILMWLWACPYLSSAGCGLVPLPAAAATLGLDQAALMGGLDTLEVAGLIACDKETGELFIVDWFRVHTFKSPVAKRCFDADLKKVQSERLKNMIAEKSMAYFPTATATETATETTTRTKTTTRTPPQRESAGGEAPLEGGKPPLSPAGGEDTIDFLEMQGICLQAGNARDLETLHQIKQHGHAEIAQAVSEARSRDPQGRAWPTAVLRLLLQARATNTSASPSTQAPAWARLFPAPRPAPASAERVIDITDKE